MGAYSKSWEDLQIYDNYIFCLVMQNEKLCRKLLEILLNIRIERIEYLNAEHFIAGKYGSRSVRLDVYVKDSDRVFDIEMQSGKYSDLLLRARYYQGAMDVDVTKSRTRYRDLKESYVLFICRDDPLGAGLPVYTKKTVFLETDAVPYADKTHTVFYNASAYKKTEDPEIRAVLQFISTLKADSDFSRELEDSVIQVKSNMDFRSNYMTVEDIIEEEKEEAREIGLAEGRATGLAEGRAAGLEQGRAEGDRNRLMQQITAKLAKNKSPEQIADEIELPLDQTLELINQVS